MTFQHTAAGLFTHRSTRWWDHHLEVTLGQGAQAQRAELDEWKVFPMGAFGYRTRYDRVLIETGRSRHVREIRQRLAEHVSHRIQTLKMPVPDKLRLVRSFWTVGSPDMAEPASKWSAPPVTEIAAKDSDTLGEYEARNGKWEIVPRKMPPVTSTSTPVVAKTSPASRSSVVAQQPGLPATAFQRPGAASPAVPPPRSQIKRRQVQQFVAPGNRPGTRSSNPLPPARVGGLDMSKLKLGQPGVPIQRMPSSPPPLPAARPPSPAPKTAIR